MVGPGSTSSEENISHVRLGVNNFVIKLFKHPVRGIFSMKEWKEFQQGTAVMFRPFQRPENMFNLR